jgi:hypothetical protein
MERRFEKARGNRGLGSLKPLIVVCRKVQQSPLGKRVGVLRKQATAFGMRFQKIRVHGNTPLNNTFNFAQRIYLIYRRRCDALKPWTKVTDTILGLVTFDGLTLLQCNSSFAIIS